MPVRTARLSALAALTIALGASACSKADDAAKRPDTVGSGASAAAPVSCAGTNAELTLPAGFCATIYADSIAHARHAAVASNGDVYVTIEGTRPPNPADTGKLKVTPPVVSFVALRDTNHDGKADLVKQVGTIGNTGVRLANGFLYVDEGKQIVRYARSDTALVPEGKREVIVSGLPMDGGHRARNIAIGSDGTLLVNVGSSTNACQKKDRTPESPGVDPCVELETRAGIWKFDANKPGQTFAAKERFATGVRNGMGLAYGPDGKAYATQHGRDQLHDNWPKVFPTTKYQAENPAEVLLQVNQGDDFGWPYCYQAVDQKKLVDAPEYGGDGTKASRCGDKKTPVVAFPGHWAPMDLLFYTGSSFPARYKDGVFIPFHGSWNRAPEPQAGYRIVFQPLTNGTASGEFETFADGFAAVAPAQLQPGTAKHRPTGIAQGPDGALYVTDDMGGRIYKITYGAAAAR